MLTACAMCRSCGLKWIFGPGGNSYTLEDMELKRVSKIQHAFQFDTSEALSLKIKRIATVLSVESREVLAHEIHRRC